MACPRDISHSPMGRNSDRLSGDFEWLCSWTLVEAKWERSLKAKTAYKAVKPPPNTYSRKVNTMGYPEIVVRGS